MIYGEARHYRQNQSIIFEILGYIASITLLSHWWKENIQKKPRHLSVYLMALCVFASVGFNCNTYI